MSSPPWDPQRPPAGPPPGYQPPWPAPQWPAAGQPYPPPAPQWPAGGPPSPYPPPYPPPPGRPPRSKTPWIIAVVVGAVAAIGLVSVVLISVLGDGSRDERSYQEGRKAGQTSSVFVKWGGAEPEKVCRNQYSLRTMSDSDSDLSRRSYMAGCLDAMREALAPKP